jgi:hypothetical protein
LQQIELKLGPKHDKNFVSRLTAALEQVDQLAIDRDEPKLVVLMLRSKDRDCYSTFKYLADVVFDFSSIVMVENSNIKKGEWATTGLNRYCGNLMMKANLELRAINHTADGRSAFGNIAEHLENSGSRCRCHIHQAELFWVVLPLQRWSGQSRPQAVASWDACVFSQKEGKRLVQQVGL